MELYTFDIEAPVTNAKKPFYDKKRNFLYFRSPIKYNYYIECSQYNANTNDKDIVAGDLLVAELDATVRIRNANDEDIDIIGMAMRKPENGKVLIKIK